MTVYHKLIHENMLNNYELGNISREDALKMGYKPLVVAQREDGKNYDIRFEEKKEAIYEILIEI